MMWLMGLVWAFGSQADFISIDLLFEGFFVQRTGSFVRGG